MSQEILCEKCVYLAGEQLLAKGHTSANPNKEKLLAIITPVSAYHGASLSTQPVRSLSADFNYNQNWT